MRNIMNFNIRRIENRSVQDFKISNCRSLGRFRICNTFRAENLCMVRFPAVSAPDWAFHGSSDIDKFHALVEICKSRWVLGSIYAADKCFIKTR